MNYPEDFKKRVKEVYPNMKKMHDALDEGDIIVGRYLDDTSVDNFSLTEILKAKSLEELQNKAREEKTKVDLYNEWRELKHQQNLG